MTFFCECVFCFDTWQPRTVKWHNNKANSRYFECAGDCGKKLHSGGDNLRFAKVSGSSFLSTGWDSKRRVASQ